MRVTDAGEMKYLHDRFNEASLGESQYDREVTINVQPVEQLRGEGPLTLCWGLDLFELLCLLWRDYWNGPSDDLNKVKKKL